MMRRYLLLIIFGVLSISVLLGEGCTEVAPASVVPTTPAMTQPISSSSNTLPPGSTPTALAAVPTITIPDAFNLIQNNKNNPDFIILDVRTAEEFGSGHLANAVNLDYYSPDFKSNLGKLDRNKEYLVYCRTGARSTAATQIMADLGFTKVHNLSGGIVQWTNARYPLNK